MNKKQLSILIAALFAGATALAQTADDPFRATGQVTAGGIVTDTSGKDQSKFNEYQDLSNGMLSNIGVTGRNSKSWINAYGENFGRDDMYVDLRGGMYDVFKARAYTNWMPHNFLYNGLTPYTGSGSNNLTATFPAPDTATWQGLNLGYQRKDTGGSFEWKSVSPWYFRVDGNQVKTQGTKNGGSSQGTSPGNGYVDLALPVQYETNNVTGEVGYATRTMTISASYLASNFGNSNETVSWNNGFYANGKDQTYLPPANDYQRIALNGTWRQLPLKSTLALRYTWDETTSNATIGTSYLGSGGNFIPTDPSSATFNGNQKRQTFTAGWAATPVTNLDTRVYLNWQKMNNNSTQIEFADGAENELWHYKKENAGVDAHYRINRANRIGGGYDYNHITQDRIDFDDTTNNTFWAEWRNTSMDTATFRIKYSYLDRRSTFLLNDAGKDANDTLYLQRFVRRFDLANLTQNRVKATVDWAPMDSTGVAVEFIWKDNDYGDTAIGRTSDTRTEIFANVTYGMPSSWRVSLFGDYETVKYDSYLRYVGAGSCNASTGPNCFDPNSPPSSAAYNWSNSLKANNWLIGLGGDVPVKENFMITGSVLYEQTDGSSDMSAQNNYGNPLPLNNYPNVKITSLNLKGVYKFDRNWSVTGGYAYQKYQYSDDQYNGYVYTGVGPNTAAASQSYLNGWNAFQPYNANIFYLLGTYRF